MIGRDGAARGKQRDLRVGEVEVVEYLHRARLARHLEPLARRPLAGQQVDVVDGEVAFVEDFTHGFADSARGADDRNVQLFHTSANQTSAAMTASAISSVPTRRIRPASGAAGMMSAVRTPSSNTALTAASRRSAWTASSKL